MDNNNTIPVFDMSAFDRNTAGDTSLQAELIKIFCAETGQYCDQLEQAVQDDDRDLWHFCTHSLKGAANALGLRNLGELCSIAQNLAPSEEKRKELRRAYSQSLKALASRSEAA